MIAALSRDFSAESGNHFLYIMLKTFRACSQSYSSCTLLSYTDIHSYIAHLSIEFLKGVVSYASYKDCLYYWACYEQ